MPEVEVRETGIDGLVVLERSVHLDARGSFERVFEPGWPAGLVDGSVGQVNRSTTVGEGSVRGLHFQVPPHSETRLVTCIRGRVYDVAVDLRAGSPTFLAWHGVELAGDGGRSLVVPPGFAHGFQVLDAEATLVYVHGGAYRPEAEGGIHPEDPAIGVHWPLPVAGLSDRDRGHPAVEDGWTGLAG